MNKKTNKKNMDILTIMQQKRKEEVLQIAEQIESILESDKSTYEKKVALFDLVKNLEVGESQPLKEQRINCLLESRLHSTLAKKALEDYRKTTIEAFSKNDRRIN